ncbi:hypothetical protein FRC17_009968 [Serendipita sp. 399]|nr:hypothetical protein FRC17_009968 [Serendipita sp. 399]
MNNAGPQVDIVPPIAPHADAAVGQGGQNNANIVPPHAPPAGAAVGQGVQNNANIVHPNAPPAGAHVDQGGHIHAAAAPANAPEETIWSWGNEVLLASLTKLQESQPPSSTGLLATVLLYSALAYGVWRIYVVLRSYQVYGPADIYAMFEPLGLLGMTFGMGMMWMWDDRETVYKKEKDTIRITPLLWGNTSLYTRSLDALRQVSGGGSNRIWIKPDWASAAVLLFGRNLISENLESWRRHRRIMQPAFNPKTYEMVWTETTKIYNDMIKTENWPVDRGGKVSLESFNEMTFKLGLYVIIACGFGLPFRWSEPPRSTKVSHSVQHNIHTVEKWKVMSALWDIFTPISLVVISKLTRTDLHRIRSIYEEYDSLKAYIRKEVAVRRTKIREAIELGEVDRESAIQFDVFSRLVLASETTDSKSGLSDEELVGVSNRECPPPCRPTIFGPHQIGNTFVLLFAGHDTTASTLAAVVAYLAIHPEEQKKVFEEVMGVIREDGDLSVSSYSKLTHTLHCFLEASRLYPAGPIEIRTCLEDTVLKVSPAKEFDSPATHLALPKHSDVIVDMVGIHYNPRVFKDPIKFLPSRWKEMNEEAYSMFSTGPRACIGKKFALTEAVCFLSNLVRDWRIEPYLKTGETLEDWKKGVLGAKIKMTLGIKDVPQNDDAPIDSSFLESPSFLLEQAVGTLRRSEGESTHVEAIGVIAHRIRDMQNLPYVVVTEEHVAQVYNLYWTAFEKLRNYPKVNNMQDNDRFCEFLREILNEHAAAIPTLSLGLSISSPYLDSDELDSFMRRMLVSRISRRVLAEHHLALTEDLMAKKTSGDNQDANVGVIFTKLSVKRCFDKFIRLLASDETMTNRLRQDSLLRGMEKLPEIIVDGDLHTTFSYIREHLEYVILELLLNALRATAIQMKASSLPIPGVIRATITSDEDDVYIRISDQGGGLMLMETQTPADLYSFSHHRNDTRMRDDRLVALQHFSQRKGGLWGTVHERFSTPGSESEANEDSKEDEEPPPMGMGLPLSNIYVTYFGGKLELLSMDGWGTDVYIKLPRLGTNLEGIEV